MDLQAAYMKQGKRDTLAKLTVALCFAVAGALMIGSLISPGKAHPRLQLGAASGDVAVTTLAVPY